VADFQTFTYLLYENNGAGTLVPLGGFKFVSDIDVDWSESSGGTVADTLEQNEVFDPVDAMTGVPFPDEYTYLGYIDTAGAAGRLYVFDNNSNGDYIVASQNDSVGGFDTSDVWPNSIDLSALNTSNLAFCFMAGTSIATRDGERAVETLKIGDLVCTAEGHEVPVKWIGTQEVMMPSLLHQNLEPVCISRGALGKGIPSEDLYVSSDHGVMLEGLLINAGALVNGENIKFMRTHKSFTYYHVETEDHDMIVANGTPVETFIDVASRRAFDNYQEYLDLYGCERIIPETSTPRIGTNRLVPHTIRNSILERGAGFGKRYEHSGKWKAV
jgi:hypothetical protein